MGALVIFVTIIIMYVVVRIGAIALELTGLDASTAQFQALSAFTGTGFTTREAELVVRHPQRRRILMALMVAGNAGIVTVIAGMVQTMQVPRPPLVTVLQFAAVVIGLYLLYRIVLLPRISKWFHEVIRRRLMSYAHIEPARFEELLEQQEGWGIFRVHVTASMPCAGKTLAEARLRDFGVTVIAIQREGRFIPSPGGHDIILEGDDIIVYGRLDAIEKLLAKPAAEAEAPPPSEEDEPSYTVAGDYAPLDSDKPPERGPVAEE